MISRQFSLRFVFKLVTLSCILVWALSAPSPTTWIATVIVASLIGAIKGQHDVAKPIRYGAIVGSLAVPILIFTYWPIFLFGFFFHDAPWPYFEDGFIVEAFFYPIGYALTYTPVGTIVGMITGLCV